MNRRWLVACVYGAYERNRTGDLFLTKEVLYLLSYIGANKCILANASVPPHDDLPRRHFAIRKFLHGNTDPFTKSSAFFRQPGEMARFRGLGGYSSRTRHRCTRGQSADACVGAALPARSLRPRAPQSARAATGSSATAAAAPSVRSRTVCSARAARPPSAPNCHTRPGGGRREPGRATGCGRSGSTSNLGLTRARARVRVNNIALDRLPDRDGSPTLMPQAHRAFWQLGIVGCGGLLVFLPPGVSPLRVWPRARPLSRAGDYRPGWGSSSARPSGWRTRQRTGCGARRKRTRP